MVYFFLQLSFSPWFNSTSSYLSTDDPVFMQMSLNFHINSTGYSKHSTVAAKIH